MPGVTKAGALFIKTVHLLPAGLPLGSGHHAGGARLLLYRL